MRFKQLVVVFLVIVVFTACSGSRSSAPPTETPGPSTPTPNIIGTTAPRANEATATHPAVATPVTGAYDIPPEIAGHEKEWPLANHDYSNTRAAVGSTINASNVATLNVAWTHSLDGTSTWGAASSSPVVSDGIVYFQDLAANIYAVKLDTGDLVWETKYDNPIFGPSGPGIGYGKVFIVSRMDMFSALDIKTGRELWQYFVGTDVHSGAFQPSVFDHRVYLSTQVATNGRGQVLYHSYQGGHSGVAIILDPDKGHLIWKFQTVEEGFWGHPEINSGAGLWFPPAIDTQSGISYWGTGNPAPFPGIKGWPNGSSRPGPNLYSDSIIALDHNTGKLLWYNQVLPHDLFNFDFQVSPILATVRINGSERGILMGSGKGGVVYGFDQETGETLWRTPIGLHQNDNLTALPEDQSTVWVAPGAWGGIETPLAYADSTVYALTTNMASPYNATMYDADTPEEALQRNVGGSNLNNATAEVDALDAATGTILWTHKFDRIALAGVTVVNDLVFTATLDGMVYALSRQDGTEVWKWQAPGGTNAWPAVVGDTIIWPFGLGDSPSVIALSLSGNQPTPTPEQQRTPVLTPAGN